jgi:hypothetical protein
MLFILQTEQNNVNRPDMVQTVLLVEGLQNLTLWFRGCTKNFSGIQLVINTPIATVRLRQQVLGVTIRHSDQIIRQFHGVGLLGGPW